MQSFHPIDHLRAMLTQNLTEAGLLGPDPSVKARRHIVLYGYSNSLLFNLTFGAFLSGFWLSLGADADWISMVIMLASLANILQLFAPFWLQKVRDPKRILIVLRGFQHGFNLLAAAIVPLLGLPEQTMHRVVLGFVVMSFILVAMTGPGLQIWHIKSIPGQRRLGFFSFLHATNVIVTFSALFLGGLFTDGLTLLLSERHAFILLRFLLVFIAVFDLLNLRKIENPGVPGVIARRRKQGLLALPRHVMAHPIYLFTILTGALWAFSVSVPGQYFIVYLITDLGYSYSLITGVSLLNLVVIIFLTPVWKRLIARLAWMRSFAVSILLYAGGLFLMAFVTAGPIGLIFYIASSFYTFIMLVGINLVLTNLTYINMPEDNQTSFVSLFNAAFHASILLGIGLGNRIMGFLDRREGFLPFLDLQNAQWLLLFTGLIVLICGLIAWQVGRVEKPQP